jgi:hypothetical protein
LTSKLNSFHKIFFDYYKTHSHSNEKINELNQLIEENNIFSEQYNNSTKNDKDLKKFDDIKIEYEKRNFYISPFDKNKNIFKGNILLSNKKDLEHYIVYNLGKSSSDIKSLSFLYKINNNLGDKTGAKEFRSINGIINRSPQRRQLIRKKKEEIRKDKNDIKFLKEEINTINEYIKKDIDHRDYPEIKSIINNTISFENVKNQYNLYKKEQNEKKTINKMSLLFNTKIKLQKKVNDFNKRIRINELSDHKEINTNNNRYLQYIKTIDNNDAMKSPLERLYDKISTEKNSLNYQSEINNYLKDKKLDTSNKLNPSYICKNFETTREKLCNSDCLKQNMQLRKQINSNILFAEKIKKNNSKTNRKVSKIEDKIIKIFCNINNQRKKVESSK